MNRIGLFFSVWLVCTMITVREAYAMHISEGIITGSSAVAYTLLGLALMGWAAVAMKRFAKRYPEKKPLLGMGSALIFFVSLMPIPAFTGTSAHPCGSPLAAILLGPVIGIGLTGISLLLQAAFFAHGGFGTWGANLLALGFFGCFIGWGVFKIARRIGAPIWASGFAAGLIGDFAVYAVSGFILGKAFAHAPNPKYSFYGYLTAIYLAYLPTQLPIAIGEMILTGLALQYAFNQRPEALYELGVVRARQSAQKATVLPLLILALAGWITAYHAPNALADENQPNAVVAAQNKPLSFAGLDETVNERLAENAGITPKEPYINTEAMGDLWNALLLTAGGVCGFVIGRWWHLLYVQPKNQLEDKH
jgi:cobalt/nickel transport system permease protein